jgi:hypothetical protein
MCALSYCQQQKLEKLSAIDIKKMNPAKVKELLKERGESLQVRC